ncbi:hypothetical protein TELCIR_08637 [Teladorsagia circumcincta]|uniref:Uncharacterized protein n=1 Tax=Teladorsagia circumcincta TaxID=45464 RepID=A0A2G9UH32_TELCI|nr:hypothetical protein TELCIR_08637 [Teladorsagia circumcincta]
METKMLRWTAGVTRLDRIRTNAIRERFGVAPIADKMREARLRWYGHVLRGSDESVRKIGLNIDVPGKRPKGVLNQITDFVASSKKFTGCTIRCISKLTPFGCEQQNNCGLNVPSDDVIVNNMVQCAIQSGVTSQAVQSLCHCLAQTGNQFEGLVKNLENKTK